MRFHSLVHAVTILLLFSSPPNHACSPSFSSPVLNSPNRVIAPPRSYIVTELEQIELDISLPGKLTIPETIPPKTTYQSKSKRRELVLKRELQEIKEITGWDDDAAAFNEYRLIRSTMFGLAKKTEPSIVKLINNEQWPAGLPKEITMYLDAASAFRAQDHPKASNILKKLLALPKPQRQHRSIWAHFLLARIELEKGDDDQLTRSLPHFNQIIELHSQGFHDSLAMRWDALEALADLEKLQPTPDQNTIIKYYFALARAGHMHSLMQLQSLAEGCDFTIAAKDPVVRQIVTAVLLSQTSRLQYWQPPQADETRLEIKWLNVLESIEVSSYEANRLAWLAYKRGEYEISQRWLNLASETDTIGSWVAAKLALRSGLDSAPAIALNHLDKARATFSSDRDIGPKYDYDEKHYRNYTHKEVKELVDLQYWGDLGTIRLANNQFVEAMDAFMIGGEWKDAAFIAEQLISIEELLSYVRKTYPEKEPELVDKRISMWSFYSRLNIGDRLRYLTARRLAREKYFKDAAAFMPEKVQPQFTEYVSHYRKFRDQNSSGEERAENGWRAAQIHKKYGMELFGTEVGPDWFCYQGSYDLGSYAAARYGLESQVRVIQQPAEYRNPASEKVKTSGFVYRWFSNNKQPFALPPNHSEMWRFNKYGKLINAQRFHYRFVAADLAWEASQFLPDNDEQTAGILNTAGIWIAHRNPTAADTFYKSLVNRNRYTELGQLADEKRWFIWNYRPELTRN